MNKNILDIEEKIDAEFANSPLAERPYSQAVWTLLSVFEDLTYKVYFIDKQSSTDIGIWNDVMLNSITHPLRILHKSKCNSTLKTQKLYILTEKTINNIA